MGLIFGTGTGGGGICEREFGKLRFACASGFAVDAIECPSPISKSTSMWKLVLPSTSIASSSPTPPLPMIGKLRDPTVGVLPLSLSFAPEVERRKFSFGFP
jgi:hypothetical protein